MNIKYLSQNVLSGKQAMNIGKYSVFHQVVTNNGLPPLNQNLFYQKMVNRSSYYKAFRFYLPAID